MIVEIDDIHLSKMINCTKVSIECIIYDYYKTQDNEIAYLFLMETNKNDLVIKIKSLSNLELWLNLLSKHNTKNNKHIILKFDNIELFNIYDCIIKYKEEKFFKDIVLNINNYTYSIDKFLLFMDVFKDKRPGSQLEVITLIYDYLKGLIVNPERDFFDDRKYKDYDKVNYIKVFKEILQLFNINSYPYFFKGRLESSSLIKNVEHNALLVNIDDTKYDVNGIYFLDLYMDGKKDIEEDNSNEYKGFLLSHKEFVNRYYVESDLSNKILFREKYTLLSSLNKYNYLYPDKYRSIHDVRYKDDLKTCYRIDDVVFCLLDEYTDIFANDNVYEMMSKVYTSAIKIFERFGSKINSDDERLIDLFINLYADSRKVIDISKSIINRTKKTNTAEQSNVIDIYNEKIVNRKKTLSM